MVKASNIPLTNNEHSLIFCHNYGIHFQPRGSGSAPVNDYGLILTCAVQLSFSFLLAMLACISPWTWATIACWVGVGLILFFRVLTLWTFLWAIIAGKYCKRFYLTSILFWGWWPVSLFVFTVTATICGYMVGSYLWTGSLEPYWELKKLQMYRDINPQNIPATRIPDAGMVDFSEFTEMDRGKGGCFMSRGNTYCLAPIVNDGTPTPSLHYGLAGLPHTGSYDYFAVGINCCTCPNKDFKCGDWNNPIARGGIRSLDTEARPYFHLALEDWQASYGKVARNPQFYEWVQEPEYVWKGYWNRFIQVFWLAMASAFALGLSIGFLCDKMLQILWQHDIICPRSVFAPAPKWEQITMLLMPKMFFRYQQEQAEIASMPISAEFHEERGPASAQEDKQLVKEGKMAGGYGYGGMGGMGGGMGGMGGALGTILSPAGAPTGSMNAMHAGMGLY